MLTVDEYRSAIHDPDAWTVRSISLFQSAEAVWKAGANSGFKPGVNQPRPEPLDTIQAFGYYKVAMMLYGLSVETALKGILVSQKSDKIVVLLETDGGGMVKRIALKEAGDSGGGHNLVSLAKNAGILSRHDNEHVEEKKHLHELSEYVAWRGRYPVPKAASADAEIKQQLTNVATISFVRSFLNQHLKWSE